MYSQKLNTTLEKGDINLLEFLINSDEHNIFLSSTVKDVLDFKWAQFGLRYQYIGFINHCCYIVWLVLYIDTVYVNGTNYNTTETEKPH